MAKIEDVDYEAIPAQAKQMRASGMELNNEITKAYASLAEMHNVWHGVRYGTLVTEFNEIIPQLNEILNLVVTEVPFALETVANNYAQADLQPKVTTAIKEPIKKINSLTVTNDVGMRFLTEQVAEKQRSIITNLRNAKEQMNRIETQYSKIVWESEAATAFKTKFGKLKNDIIKSFDNIETEFSKLMNQTQDDMASTESANTIQ